MANATKGDCEFVFHRGGKQIGAFQLYGPWERACLAVGLENRLIHDFRRTGVRNMIRAGVTTNVASESGHKTDSVFHRYDIVDERDLNTAADRVDRYIEKQRLASKEPVQTRSAN